MTILILSRASISEFVHELCLIVNSFEVVSDEYPALMKSMMVVFTVRRDDKNVFGDENRIVDRALHSIDVGQGVSV